MVDLLAQTSDSVEQPALQAGDFSLRVITDRHEAIHYVEAMPDGLVSTGHQSKSFLRAWLAQENSRPQFYIFTKAGHGPVLLPLERNNNGTAIYCGGSHVNGNFPIGDAGDITALGKIQAKDIQKLVASHDSAPAALFLERQYDEWQGIANPFVFSSSSRSQNVALSLSLEGGFAKVLQKHTKRRKRQRYLVKKLSELGTVNFVQHVGCSDLQPTLAKFFEMKAARFKDAGINDVFGDKAVQGIFTQTLMESCNAPNPSRQLKVLLLNDEPISIIGCVMSGERITVEFGAFDPQYANSAPGDLLFYHAIEDSCEKGFKVFDFGIGDEFYKRRWCEIETWHLDTFVPITSKGQVLALGKRLRNQLVGKLKRNRHLWPLVKKLRKKYG